MDRFYFYSPLRNGFWTGLGRLFLMKTAYGVPVSDPTGVKESFLESVSDKSPKMVRWFLMVFDRENLDFSEAVESRVKKVKYFSGKVYRNV